jgi:membrane-bound metal-dependent hydrolase YbcI (DUF457 family)
VPFTLAHPAAILPLRRRLVFSALVIGAMAPDFHYFLGLHVDADISHSVAGAFYFCLPAGLAALWLFHRVLKEPLISLAPEWHQARLARFAMPFRLGPGRQFALILLSLLAGIFSHLLWDSFTHSPGWMVRHFPELRSVVLQDFLGGRPLYNVLQHGSSLLGLAILALAYRRWSRNNGPQPANREFSLDERTKWGILAGIGLAAFLLSGAYAAQGYARSGRFAVLAGHGVIAFMAITFFGLLGFSLWWHREFR